MFWLVIFSLNRFNMAPRTEASQGEIIANISKILDDT